MERFRVELEVDESPRVVVESDGAKVVGQEYLPIHLALGRMVPVVEQMWVVVDLGAFDSQPAGCRGCLLAIQLILLNR